MGLHSGSTATFASLSADASGEESIGPRARVGVLKGSWVPGLWGPQGEVPPLPAALSSLDIFSRLL